MWWNGGLVLLPLLVVATLHGTVNCAIELDMAPDAVDDTYTGCRDAVLKKVLESGLREELDASPEFKAAWTANKECPPVVPPGGLKQHGQALLAFAYGGKDFRNTFNRAVRTMGHNHSFPFQSLHFLLMDTMALLQNESKVCRTVYHVSSRKYSAQRGAKVRLGEFVTASSDLLWLMEEPDLEDGVLFNITSCFVLNLSNSTCMQEEVELLLLPTEGYTVEDVVAVADHDTLSHTRISLKHATFRSEHNCYLNPRAQEGSSSTVLGCTWGVYLTVYLTVYLAVAVLGLLN